MSSVPGSAHLAEDGPAPVFPTSHVPGTALKNVLCKLPQEVTRKVLSSFLDLADIVRLDSAALVHNCRQSFQHMYQGIIVANTTILPIDFKTADWLMSRAVYVQNMRLTESLVAEWPMSFSCMMREATTVIVEAKTGDDVLDSNRINAMLGNCRQLTSLDLQGCTFEADALQAVPSMCPLLQALSLACTNADNNMVLALMSPRIVSLDLSYPCHFNDETVAAVTAACPNLKSLNLESFISGTGASLEAIGRNCPQLQELNLREFGFSTLSDESMAVLAAGCRDLRTLHIQFSTVLTGAGVRAIAACCTKLETVTLLHCRNLTADAIAVLVSSCPELRIVHIQADDAVLVALSQHCPHLADVTVEKFWDNAIPGSPDLSFSGEPFADLLRNCQELRKLRITSDFSALPPCGDGIISSVEVLHLHVGWSHGDEAVSSMLQYMPRLRELNCHNCSNLTAATVLTAAAHCPLLQEVDFTHFHQLTDVSIIALAQRCPLLCKINLSNYSNFVLTDAAVIAIAQHCPHLTYLNLHNESVNQLKVPLVSTGDEMADLLAVLDPALREDVYPDTSISDASIAALAAHSHRLRELDVHGHALISEAALTALTVALPLCRLSEKPFKQPFLT